MRIFIYLLLIINISFVKAKPVIVVRKGETVKERCLKEGLKVYCDDKIIEALIRYNDHSNFVLTIPPLSCLKEGNDFIPYCHFGVSRSLTFFNKRFTNSSKENSLIHFMDSLAKKDQEFDLLELGFGIGVLLLEAQTRYPEAKITGINDKPLHGVKDWEALEKVAFFFGYTDSTEWQKIKNKPKLIFHDLDQGEMDNFKSDTYEVILSQSTLQYLTRKDLVIQQVYRLLAPGGRAFLHLKNIRFNLEPDAGKSLDKFVSMLKSHNPDILIQHSKDFLFLIEKKLKDYPPFLKIPFEFEKSLHYDEAQKRGLIQPLDGNGRITFFKSEK